MSTAAQDLDFQFAATVEPADASAHRMVAISDRSGRPLSRTFLRPPRLADIEQARIFEDLLEAELADLQHTVGALHNRWHRHCAQREVDEDQPPESLVHHREQLNEVRCLLAALRDRFPDLTDHAITRVPSEIEPMLLT